MPYGDGTVGIVISIHASRGGSDFNPRVHREAFGISIHASRGGSDRCGHHYGREPVISIHASRGGSDPVSHVSLLTISYFNPRFPRGKRLRLFLIALGIFLFQSTLPAGEATDSPSALSMISPISIHASRGGSDVSIATTYPRGLIFQSTLPAGEATYSR